MKLFCEDCKKTFQVSDEAVSAGKAVCPDCETEYVMPENSTIFPGRVIGDFLIESTIGKGGMGEIYAARQISLDRKVALKILQDRFTGDSEYVEGLFREARAAAKVSHPNIVQAYAVGEEDGIFYFAMELIRGETFKQIIQREKIIAPERALKVIREIASAIDAAWREQKLVHQDIKPDNIMLDANGFAKLADLGLARKAGVNDEHAEVGDEVLGTPQYISPEQLTGVPTDVRSDIYSLGATFFQMVTGRYAYVADTVEEMSRKHVDGKLEPPNTVNPDVPDSVNSIIMKMMARNIEERYQDPQELIKDIDNALQGKSGSGKKTPPSLSLKLKRANGAEEKKAAAQKAAAVTPVAPAGAKKAATVTPVAPTGAKKAATVTPVAPAGAKKAAVTPVAPAEAEKTAEKQVPAAAEEEKNKTAQETPAAAEEKTEENKAAESTQSVRSALIAKHNDAEAAEEEKQEVEELIASTPNKKNKKIIVISLISVGAVLVLLLSAAIVLLVCADKPWIPGFAKPIAEKLNGSTKAAGNKIKQKLREKLKKKEIPQDVVPEKKVPQTRKEFLTKVEEFLTLYRNNPNEKKQWHEKMQPELEYFLAPQTDEERRAAKPLILIWHRIDELVVFAPHRKGAQEKHLAKLRKIEEARLQAEKKAEEKRLLEEKRKAEELAKIERDRQRVEQERKEKFVKLKGELDTLINPLAQGAVAIFRGEDSSAYETALLNVSQFPLPHAENIEEDKEIKKYINNVNSIKRCVADFREFTKSVADVSSYGITIRIRKGGRGQLVQMLGLSADGTLRYQPIGGKAAETNLKNQRGISLATPLRVVKQAKNVDFFVQLMSGRSAKELKTKTRNSAWLTVLNNFSSLF